MRCAALSVHVLGFTRIQAFPALSRAGFEAVICYFVHQILHELLLHLLTHSLQIFRLLLRRWLLRHADT